MNSNPQEDQFRALFDAVKQADARRAPAFERDWATADSKTSPFFSQLRYGRLAGALAAVVTVATGVGLLSHQRSGNRSIAIKLPSQTTLKIDSGAEDPPISLDTWQSPTAFLLRASDEWGQPVESIDESFNLSPSTQPKPRHST